MLRLRRYEWLTFRLTLTKLGVIDYSNANISWIWFGGDYILSVTLCSVFFSLRPWSLISAELTVGHILWPVTYVTHQAADPWPAWPVTNDLVPENGMSRSLTNHDEFTTIAFYSLQSGILHMTYAVYIQKSSSLHGKCYKLNTVNSSLIMGQVFYGIDRWPTWPIHICPPVWPMTHDPLTHCLLWISDLQYLSAIPSHTMNISDKFRWNVSTK